MTDTEIKECQEWLDKLKLDDIPKHKERKKTLMDIAGIDHLETKWSSIYAYFFNPKESHGLGTLFYDSLSEILRHKNPDKKIQMNDFSVKTEEPAKDENGNTKFIDILLCDGEYAIIIENKVNAPLYNPLQIYWDSVNIEDCKKCGIVLSLHSINVREYNSNYLNITHGELIKQIEKNLHKYYLSADSKALIFLQEFIRNIYNQENKSNMDKNVLNFYYKGDNRTKINNLAKIRNNIINVLSEQIENDIMNQLLTENGLKLEVIKKKNNRYTYYSFKECNVAMITLVYYTLWGDEKDGCRIQAILEFQGDIKDWVEKNESMMTEKSNTELKKENSYWHYISEDFRFEDPATELFDGFQNRIIEKLKNSNVYKVGCEIVDLYLNRQK